MSFWGEAGERKEEEEEEREIRGKAALLFGLLFGSLPLMEH